MDRYTSYTLELCYIIFMVSLCSCKPHSAWFYETTREWKGVQWRVCLNLQKIKQLPQKIFWVWSKGRVGRCWEEHVSPLVGNASVLLRMFHVVARVAHSCSLVFCDLIYDCSLKYDVFS